MMANQTKILIVDDERDILKSFKLWIESEGFTVFTANSGEKAAEILKKQPIEICLLDLRLGEESGIEVAGQLSEKDEFLKTIIITGYPSYDTALESLKSGIFDYISKSELQKDILAKIKKAVESRSEQIAKLNNENKGKYKLGLVCNHTLVKEGFLNFCEHESEFRLIHTFHSFDYIKKSDFNNEIDFTLLCPLCNEDHFDDPSGFITKLNIFFPNSKIVFTEDPIEDDKKVEFIKMGVRGFLQKSISTANLKRALKSISKNEFWISRKMNENLISQLIDLSQGVRGIPNTENVFQLSARELEILQAISSGLTNLEISEKFFISEKTVKAHVYNLYKKMGVKSRTQALKKAMDFHVI